MPRNDDTSFVDNLTPSFAQLFLDRVAKTPAPRRSATRSATPGSRSPGSRPATGSATSPPGCSRSASSPSSASASPRRPATSGSSPTSRSCAPAAPRPRSTPRPTPRTRRTSSATPSARSSSPRTTSRSRSSPSSAASCRTVGKVVTFDGTADGDWVITLDALADLGEKYLVEHPDAIETTVAGDQARPARHPDLHLRHHRPAQGRPAARTSPGSTRARRSQVQDILARGRPAVPVAADGALVRQGAALRPAGLRLRDRHRRPGRQDRRQPGRREADVHGRRPAHLREGARPDRHHAAGRGRR